MWTFGKKLSYAVHSVVAFSSFPLRLFGLLGLAMKDIVGVFLHFLATGDKYTGIYNAGFENISILDLAKMIAAAAPAEIEIKPSNDPRSYRQNSDKLLATGFAPKYGVADGIRDVVEAYRAGKLRDEDGWYNVRTMKGLGL